VALPGIAADFEQVVELLPGLDAFRHRGELELLRQRHHGADERGVGTIGADIAHERLVDLELVHREAVEISERRVTRAEVVHRDAHAQRRELVQRADGMRSAVHDRRLGDLDLEAARREPGLHQDRLDRFHDVLLAELARREVHRDLHPGVAQVEPGPALAAGLLQRPQPDRHDEPAFLRDRDEFRGRHHPLPVVPPQQRLGAEDAPGLQRHDRLEVQHEFVALERTTQAQLQLRMAFGARGHVVREALEVVAPFALGMVHREVGVAQERVGVLVVHRVDREADACREVQLVARNHGALGHRGEQALRDLRDLVEVGQALEQHGELVVAQPRQGVDAAQARLQPARGLREHVVAHRLPERVVDLLEVVEIEDHHREEAPAAIGAGDGVIQAVGEQRPVRQPGERFVMREARERLLDALPLGDLGADAAIAAERAGTVEHRLAAQGEVAQFAAGMLAHELEAAKGQARLERRHVGLPARGVRGHGVQLRARPADEPLARQRAAVARAVRKLGQPVLGVGFPVEVGREAHERVKALLGQRAALRGGAPRRRPGPGRPASFLLLFNHPRREITRPQDEEQKKLARDRVEQPGHRLVGPVVRVALDLLVAARPRGRVDALALAEAVPELLHFLGRHVVGAPITRGAAHRNIVAPLR